MVNPKQGDKRCKGFFKHLQLARGWWRMGDNDNGTGTTITDQGSGSSDGTLVNSPTFSTTVPS